MTQRTVDLRYTLARLDSIVLEYKLKNPKNIDRKNYEIEVQHRIRECFSNLESLIAEATSAILVQVKPGPESKLSLEQKVKLLLIKQIVGKSNRSMAFMLAIFSALTNIDVSYKTIERIFSGDRVKIAILNLHILTLRKRNVNFADAVGDGTGYTIFIGDHYATTASQLKDKAKNSNSHNKKIHYFFAIMDIKTRLYVGYGSSLRCEQDAYREALKMTKLAGVELTTFRVDRLFSAEAYCDEVNKFFGDVKFVTIPKKNIAHYGLGPWCKMLKTFMEDTQAYLKVYFQRNQAESGHAEDKKRTGWRIFQKREERVETAQGIIALWHNLSWVWAG